MTLILPNQGELKLVEWMLSTDDIELHLFKSNTTPSATSTVGSFTEADFTDYASVVLDKDNWTFSTVSGEAVAEQPEVTWTSGSSQVVYGYWCEHDGDLLWAERFGTPRSLAVDEVLTLTPKFAASSQA